MLFALILYAGLSFNGSLKPTLKLSQEFSTFDSLLKNSPIAITGTVTTNNKEFSYKEMTFAITEVQVNEAIRGADSLQTINILQTKSLEDPYLEKGKEVLLFLSEYEGPIADNVYVINGLYNGQFEIKDHMISSVSSENKLQLTSTKLEDVISKIKNTAYVSNKAFQTPSSSDVESDNDREKQLKQQLENESATPEK